MNNTSTNRNHSLCLKHPGWVAQQERKLLRMQEQKQQRIDKYNTNPKLCKQCTAPLSYTDSLAKKVFCDSSCAMSFRNAGKGIAQTPCVQCGTPTVAYTKRYSHAFCSPECNLEHRSDQAMIRFTSGEIIHRQTLRRCLLKIKGHVCWACDTTLWCNQPIPLEVNHIDGNATNNFPANLELICPNCHALTPTYKGRNKGNGRQVRGLRST